MLKLLLKQPKKLIFILALCLFPLLAISNELPDIGSYSLSEDDEYIIGRNWLYQSNSKLDVLIDEPIITEYIRQLVYEMAAYSGIKGADFKVILVDDNQINAFAISGGIIGIHLGLIAITENEDELASVIAHEIGHIKQKHYAEIVTGYKANTPQRFGAMLAAVGFMLAGLPGYGIATLIGSSALDQERGLESIRENETEADDISLNIMTKSGRNPQATVNFLERLLNHYGNGDIPLIFRTHPLTQTRVNQTRSKSRSVNTPKTKGNLRPSKLDFFIVKTLAKVIISNKTKYELIADLNQQILNEPLKNNYKQQGNTFSLASLYLENKEPKKAIKLLNKLLKLHPLNTFIHSMLAKARVLNEGLDNTKDYLKKLLLISPNNYSIQSTLVSIYLNNKNADEALKILNQMNKTWKNNIWIQTQLKAAYAIKGMLDEYNYTRGEEQFLYANYQLALDILTEVKQETKNKLVKIKVTERIKEIQDFYKKVQVFYK